MFEIKLYIALVLAINPMQTDKPLYALKWTQTQQECNDTLQNGVTYFNEKYKGYMVQGRCLEYVF